MGRRVLVLVALLGCREQKTEIKAAPERDLPRIEPAVPSASAVVTSLIGHVGEEVTVSGRADPAARPRIAWTVKGKSALLLDVDESHLRIVAHVAELPTCTGTVLLSGNVIVARGMVRQGTTEGDYAEPQLDVTRWSCR